MKKHPSTYEEVAVEAVRPHPRNPRRGNVDVIEASIGSVGGFYGSLLAQRSTGFILAGEHRWKAAQRAGADKIPVIWLDVDDNVALRILLADNRAADLATYDLTALIASLDAYVGRLETVGYTADDLDDLIASLGETSLDVTVDAEHAAPAERGEDAGQTRNQQGLRDAILVFQMETWREYVELLTRLRRKWDLTSPQDVVLRAVNEAASAI